MGHAVAKSLVCEVLKCVKRVNYQCIDMHNHRKRDFRHGPQNDEPVWSKSTDSNEEDQPLLGNQLKSRAKISNFCKREWDDRRENAL